MFSLDANKQNQTQIYVNLWKERKKKKRNDLTDDLSQLNEKETQLARNETNFSLLPV